MNEKTKEALITFAKEVADLAYAASQIIGTDQMRLTCIAAARLIDALQKDETLP